MAGVEVTGVKKAFGTGKQRVEVLRGVDLDVNLGEILLLAGPSGSGKTTFLCVVAGLLDADDGQIRIFGESLEGMDPEAKTGFRSKNIGFVFQQFNLLPTLSAQENVAVPMLIRKEPRKAALRTAAGWLDRVGLGPRMDARPADLSGGEQQRVAIARALSISPRLLVCDEPTASLDGDTGSKVMTILRSTALDEQRCILVVTHDSRIFPFGDRLAHMLDGRIVSVEPLRKDPKKEEG